MIEKIVYDFLSASLSKPVFMDFPEVPSEGHPELPEEFVVIEKVGGSVTDYIWGASFAIQSYSLKSLYNAAALDVLVRNAMDGMADSVKEISECSMTSDVNFTDVSTKRYRYQCVYQIYY